MMSLSAKAAYTRICTACTSEADRIEDISIYKTAGRDRARLYLSAVIFHSRSHHALCLKLALEFVESFTSDGVCRYATHLRNACVSFTEAYKKKYFLPVFRYAVLKIFFYFIAELFSIFKLTFDFIF